MLTTTFSLPPSSWPWHCSSLVLRIVKKVQILPLEVSCFCGYGLYCVLSSWLQRTLRSCYLPPALDLSIFSGSRTESPHSSGEGSLCGFSLSHIQHHPHNHHFPLLIRSDSGPCLPGLPSLSLCSLHLSMAHIRVMLPTSWITTTFHDITF